MAQCYQTSFENYEPHTIAFYLIEVAEAFRSHSVYDISSNL
ncbi:hypothetical protein [Anaplasma phagocytophilum]|uniref:Uncharacterized protein n=3 Tax=Anaplasma phagocytophilum TaxID=948 RepID=Q2GK19_ANAPZ|nr:hypothetical protein APH_0701 [Anaplasma phagocytophilum str. HZ]KJV63104.1 hypothetical protein EPHNCH_1008 [Anaplasma phagocytophilum str. NCH-1]KJV83417.1 hypothetical protein APHHGE2_0995 [Anaplasma phagocytophilum str. HGE2]KJV84760.1 hypothetical protein APHWI1_0197 [Anaplasma phagocytophilum str. ApWI1]KJV87385.1 hypothetical protein APHNYW_0706 [Anaplasma phagocytophilum str. ApNYW]KJV98795.1 hypothetical protein OTSANNIE_0967 [Anaplasma phagocytophilum str. Annie]KJZ98165.1 hypoth